MILTVLVGNTSTRITGFSGPRVTRRRVTGSKDYLSDPARCLAGLHGVDSVALAAVVPGALAATRRVIRAGYGLPVFHVDRRTRTGLRIHYRRSQLGADRICSVVGAKMLFPGEDLIVLDLGTAVTVNVVSAEGHLLGGAILPGRSLMLAGLGRTRSRLPRTTPGTRYRITQHDTRAAMQAGVQHLLVGGLAHLVRAVQQEIGRRCGVVATGGDAAVLRGGIANLRAIDNDLAARGLIELYRLNRLSGR